jgi:outer membrane receptor protein involved in Fe transport
MSSSRLQMARRAMLALSTSLSALSYGAPAIAQQIQNSGQLENIVVTAQKRVEDIKEVPLSVSVVSGDELTEAHTADYEDLARSVPGIAFSNNGGAGLDRIEMRGIASSAGSPTVSMYMNDVPITIPNLINTGASQPRFFDLDHIEVLRGPQGTLYGSSSMGGSIKFVTHEPELDKYSGSAYLDVSGTDHGGVNYEGNAVANIPLIPGKLGLRIGFDDDHESGYIDHLDANGAVDKKGTNSQESMTGRVSLKWQATDDLVVIPELNFQRTVIGDTAVFYLDDPIYDQSKLVRESGHDDMVIPSLTIRDDLHWADLTSVSSYFWRHYPRTQDGTYYNSALLVTELQGDPTLSANYPNVDPTPIGNIPSVAYITPLFRQLSEEVRLTSKPMEETGKRYAWIGGLFFSDFKLHLSDDEYMNGVSNQIQQLYGSSAHDILSTVLYNSGLQDQNYNNFLLGSLDEVYMQNYSEEQKQYAVFGEFTYQILDHLKATVGLRILRSTDTINGIGGSYYNADATPNYSGSTSYNGYTPKFSLSYDLGNGSIYASGTKGVRLGGFNEPVPQFACQGDLAALGISKTPANYQADSLWSYEAGTKLALYGNRVSLDTAAYYISWKNVQQEIPLDTCGYDFTTNAGNAKSYGGEMELRAKVTPELTLSASGSGTAATLTSVSLGAGAAVGQSLIGVPDWTASFGADYTLPINDDDAFFARADLSLTGPSHGAFNNADPDYSRPSYSDIDASLGLIWHKVQWQLYGKNLTNNQKVIQHPNLLSVSQGYTLRPLTVGLSASAKF